MGMGFAPTWLPQVSPPLLHKTTLTTVCTIPWFRLILRPVAYTILISHSAEEAWMHISWTHIQNAIDMQSVLTQRG